VFYILCYFLFGRCVIWLSGIIIKIPEIRKEKVYFGSVSKLHMISWPHRFGHVIRQHIMIEGCSRAKLFTLWSGNQRQNEERGPIIPFEGTFPMT
jgi:hypothetical protein